MNLGSRTRGATSRVEIFVTTVNGSYSLTFVVGISVQVVVGVLFLGEEGWHCLFSLILFYYRYLWCILTMIILITDSGKCYCYCCFWFIIFLKVPFGWDSLPVGASPLFLAACLDIVRFLLKGIFRTNVSWFLLRFCVVVKILRKEKILKGKANRKEIE